MVRRVRLSVRVGFALVLLLVLNACRAPDSAPLPAPPPGALAVPSQFEDVRLAAVANPTALAFVPDGRLFITTQPGQVRVFENGSLRSSPLVNLRSRLCTNGERGLLGIAVDPAFSSNGFIYLYYTLDKAGTGGCEYGKNSRAVNRVSRFTVSGNAAALSSERVLIDNIPAPFGNHNSGDLQFGKDGFLYITVGDAGCDPNGEGGCAGQNDAARDRHTLLGKVLRITQSGGIPEGNPFRGANSVRCNTGGAAAGKVCQETFTWGLRNPFRFAFDPNSSGTRFFINDVGQAAREEINLGRVGADYGWNLREGRCKNGGTECGGTPPGLTDPIFDYARTGLFAGCTSITGGAFVPNGVWPASFDGSYLFSDYVCGKIFKLTPSRGSYSASVFADGLGNSSAVHLRFGPHGGTQALFYTTYAGGGQVRRVAYTGRSNGAPQAAVTATPTAGAAPLKVTFDASGSRDPEGGALTYRWRFGDGATGSGPRVTHTFQKRGDFTATLTVRDPQGAEGTATVRISAGNTAPVPRITAPAPSTLFGVGEGITLRGTATDAEDGTLAGSRLSWRVLLRHDDHTHPYLDPTTGREVKVTMPAPEDLAATTTSYLEVYLTATDSRGVSRTVRQDVHPKLVDVTFRTEPSGLKLTVGGQTFTTPRTLASWVGYRLDVHAEAQTTTSGQRATFASWSDGGAAAHTIRTPAAGGRYTARFTVK